MTEARERPPASNSSKRAAGFLHANISHAPPQVTHLWKLDSYKPQPRDQQQHLYVLHHLAKSQEDAPSSLKNFLSKASLILAWKARKSNTAFVSTERLAPLKPVVSSWPQSHLGYIYFD